MKDLQRIPMDHPKLKFGTSMDAIGVYSAEIDCIQYLNDAFDIMRRNQIPWLNALTYLTDYKSYNKKLQPTIRCAQQSHPNIFSPETTKNTSKYEKLLVLFVHWFVTQFQIDPSRKDEDL